MIAKSDTDVSLAARAAQGQIRGLLATQRQAAAQTILEYFATGKLINAVDLQGRMIAADENLLALHLMQAGDPRRSETLKRLVGWVNNYRLPIPSAQRLFLMGELKAMGVKPETFPTYEAESLAASALEAGDIRAGFGLEETRVAHLWKLTAKGGHAVGLIKGLNVVMANTLVTPSLGVSISLILPGGNGVAESIPAGPMLPGWQIGLTFHEDHSLEKAARQRTSALPVDRLPGDRRAVPYRLGAGSTLPPPTSPRPPEDRPGSSSLTRIENTVSLNAAAGRFAA